MTCLGRCGWFAAVRSEDQTPIRLWSPAETEDGFRAATWLKEMLTRSFSSISAPNYYPVINAFLQSDLEAIEHLVVLRLCSAASLLFVCFFFFIYIIRASGDGEPKSSFPSLYRTRDEVETWDWRWVLWCLPATSEVQKPCLKSFRESIHPLYGWKIAADGFIISSMNSCTCLVVFYLVCYIFQHEKNKHLVQHFFHFPRIISAVWTP